MTTLSHTDTRPFTDAQGAGEAPMLTALTVIAHRDSQRVGELAVLTPLLSGKAVNLSRLEPNFAHRRGSSGTAPLADERLSRKGLRLTAGADGHVRIETRSPGQDVFVEGVALDESRDISPAELEAGVTLLLARSVCLLLHRLGDISLELALQDDGMVGESRALQRARQAARRAASNDDPVLIRGESGCGKEPTAALVHDRSDRRAKLKQVVNLAGIPSEMAASTLFGSVRGAYTGATQRPGQFQSAHGTTLVLDEIGLAGLEVQQALLRAIENREVRRVGATELEKIDVRLIASTDRDLEAKIEQGLFLAPLLHRLEANRIWLAPLRERREDIGRLFYFFVRQRLKELGRLGRLRPDAKGGSWVPAWLVERLVRHRWPGNIRELSNAARDLVGHGLDDPRMSWVPELEQRLTAPDLAKVSSVDARTSSAELETDGASSPQTKPNRSKTVYRDADSVDDQELEQAMAKNDYVVAAAARDLGVRRTALVERIDRHPTLRLARDLSKEELEQAIQDMGFQPHALAQHFKVGKKALKDHIRKIGLHPDDRSGTGEGS